MFLIECTLMSRTLILSIVNTFFFNSSQVGPVKSSEELAKLAYVIAMPYSLNQLDRS